VSQNGRRINPYACPRAPDRRRNQVPKKWKSRPTSGRKKKLVQGEGGRTSNGQKQTLTQHLPATERLYGELDITLRNGVRRGGGQGIWRNQKGCTFPRLFLLTLKQSYKINRGGLRMRKKGWKTTKDGGNSAMGRMPIKNRSVGKWRHDSTPCISRQQKREEWINGGGGGFRKGGQPEVTGGNSSTKRADRSESTLFWQANASIEETKPVWGERGIAVLKTKGPREEGDLGKREKVFKSKK